MLHAIRRDDEGGFRACWAFDAAEVETVLGAPVADVATELARYHGEWPRLQEAHLADLCWAFEVPFEGSYGGPGRPFAHETCIRVRHNRLVFTRSGGLDI